MNLIERTRNRVEEKNLFEKEYIEQSQVLVNLIEEYESKVSKKFELLKENSNIQAKKNMIQLLTQEIEDKEKSLQKLAKMYAKRLSKKMGIDSLRKNHQDMYEKIHSEQIALTFKFKDLRKELFELSGKKPKIHVNVQDLIWNANSASLNMEIKGCRINLETILSDLRDCYGKEPCLGEWLDVKNLSNLTLSIKDYTLLNFFEEKTESKTQEYLKQALLNLDNNSQQKNVKNID